MEGGRRGREEEEGGGGLVMVSYQSDKHWRRGTIRCSSQYHLAFLCRCAVSLIFILASPT